MQCPKCHRDQNDSNSECPFCGIIFEKYYQAEERRSSHSKSQKSEAEGEAFESRLEQARRILFQAPAESHSLDQILEPFIQCFIYS